MTTASDKALKLPGLPLNSEGPVFREPWEAQAFALVLKLHEDGHFTWAEWAETLSTAISSAQSAGDCDDGSTYYSHWLSALETLVTAKNLSSPAELTTRKDEWDRAVRNTPHGQPIELEAGNAMNSGLPTARWNTHRYLPLRKPNRFADE